MANTDRKPAVDQEQRSDRPLSEISAAEFLQELGRFDRTSLQALRVWPEKKKYELLIEPENFGGIKLGDFIHGMREKKKLELEKSPQVEFDSKIAVREDIVDPRTALRDPVFIRELALEVARQLRGQG